MTPDQYRRLAIVEEKIADLFINEADPDVWPAEGSDRYRAKRSAMETAQLLARTQAIQERFEGQETHDPEWLEKHFEKRIHSAEHAAEKAVAAAMKRRSGAT